MSDNLPDVIALTAEARTLAKAYVGVGHRHGVENLLTRLADSLESLSARVTKAEATVDEARKLGVDHTAHCDAWADMNGSDCTCGRDVLYGVKS